MNMQNMQYKEIDTLLLLSCNAGHQDYIYTNPAYMLWKKNSIRQVVSCDGTHYRCNSGFLGLGSGVTHIVKGDDVYKSFLTTNKSRKSMGFVLYNKSSRRLDVYSIGYKFGLITDLLAKIGKRCK